MSILKRFIKKVTTAVITTAITASTVIAISAGATDYVASGNNVRNNVWGDIIGYVNEGTVFTPDYIIYDSNGNAWSVNGSHYIYLGYCTPTDNTTAPDISEPVTEPDYDYNYGNENYSSGFFNYNQQVIYNHFKEQGFPDSSSLAIASNLYDESGCDPTAYCIDTNDYISYGICQWNADRFDNLQYYCYLYGYDYSTLYGQLEFLDYEFQNHYPSLYWEFLNSGNSRWETTERAYDWASRFEVCADYFWQGRADHAGDLWDSVNGY